MKPKRMMLLIFALAIPVAAGSYLWREHGGGEVVADVPTMQVKRGTLTRKVQAEGTLRSVKSTSLTVPNGTRGPMKIVELAEDGVMVKKGDLLVRFDSTDLTEELEKHETKKEKTEAQMARQRGQGELQVQNRERSADQAATSREHAERYKVSDPDIFSRNQIIEADIDKSLYAARAEHAQKAKKIQQRLSRERLGLLNVDRKRAQLEIERTQEQLSALEVSAPHDGIFIVERDNAGQPIQVGDRVWRRQTVGHVSRLEELEAQVHVLEADASGLEVGRTASLWLEAHPARAFKAEVQRVGALAKRLHKQVPAQYFEVILRLKDSEAEVMKPGKRVRAELELGNAKGLIVPRQAVLSEGGKSRCYRLVDGEFELVDVKLAGASPGRVVVESGLNEGDSVALTDPRAEAAATIGSTDKPATGAPQPGRSSGRGHSE